MTNSLVYFIAALIIRYFLDHNRSRYQIIVMCLLAAFIESASGRPPSSLRWLTHCAAIAAGITLMKWMLEGINFD